MKKAFIGILTVAVIAAGILGAAYLNKNNSAENNSSSKSSIIVGTSSSYKPYTFVDEKDELTGFDVEVWREIGKRLDKKVDFQTSNFSGLFGMLDNKQLTTIANQITITDERKEKYYFTEPYVYYGAQLVVKKGDSEIKDLETLKGKKVGVSLGSNYEKMIKEFDRNNEIEVITYESYIGSLQDVSIGRIDAVLNDKLAAMISIEESGLDLQLGGDPIQNLENSFPFVKNAENEKLIDEINNVLEEIKKDGTLKSISLKWFPVDITKK